MFVSSYSTYIQSNSSNKEIEQKTEKVDSNSKSFSSQLTKPSSSVDLKNFNSTINYISQRQVFSNKQEIQNQKDKGDNKAKTSTNKFNLQSSLINAKDAYSNNSKMFSLFKKPHATINQTPKIGDTLPKEPQDIKELNMRYKMVNTYIANDNYYKITA